jgi:hypothetical protein
MLTYRLREACTDSRKCTDQTTQPHDWNAMLRKIVDIVHDRRQGQLQDAIGQYAAGRDEIVALKRWVAVEVCLEHAVAVWEA